MGISDGQSSVYYQIRLKPDNREIYIPYVTHLGTTIEDMDESSQSPKFKTNCVRVCDHLTQASSLEPDVCPEESPEPSLDLKHDLESM
jgi:hypothetical protein